MSEETDTPEGVPAHNQFIESISKAAWVTSKTATRVPIVQYFDLTGFADFRLNADRRLEFPDRIPGLSFDPNKLIASIVGGFLVNGGKETVEVYYPHLDRLGNIESQTKFRMSLDDSVKILKTTASAVNLSQKDLEEICWRLEDYQALERPAEMHTRVVQISNLNYKTTHLEGEALAAERQLPIEIHGEPYRGITLTKAELDRIGLKPEYNIDVDGATVYVSIPYEAKGGRVAFVAFVKRENKLIARTFYRSNSQGIWRYLPEYETGKDGSIEWFGKGHQEDSIILPIPLQKALSDLSNREKPKRLANPNLVFAGTARKLSSTNTFYGEVLSEAERLPGNFYPTDRRNLIPPEEVDFEDSTAVPDFERAVASWEQNTALYGRVRTEVFPSRDGRFYYLFCRDERNRAWIGGVDTKEPIGSTGLRPKWVNLGCLGTPAFEYTAKSGQYGNPDLRYPPFYIDMFKNYLSRISVIKQYLARASN